MNKWSNTCGCSHVAPATHMCMCMYECVFFCVSTEGFHGRQPGAWAAAKTTCATGEGGRGGANVRQRILSDFSWKRHHGAHTGQGKILCTRCPSLAPSFGFSSLYHLSGAFGTSYMLLFWVLPSSWFPLSCHFPAVLGRVWPTGQLHIDSWIR